MSMDTSLAMISINIHSQTNSANRVVDMCSSFPITHSHNYDIPEVRHNKCMLVVL